MAVFRHLLERMGFVKLDRYGLVRTPEGRILSIRPAVLDDGTGGRVVGWQDDDLAMAELSVWPASTQATGHRAPAPLVAAPAVQVASAAMTVAPAPVQAPAAASAVVMPVAVAPDPVVDEDDWEWTIALARARATAEETETAATAEPPSPPSPIRTRPMAAVAVKEPAVAISRSAHAAPPPAISRAATPTTVIPVPKLPSVKHSGKAGRLEPVVRTNPASTSPASGSLASGSSPSAFRLAKGTGPVDSTTPGGPPALSDDTVPNLSIGDQTKLGVGLPPAARAVQLPSIKRRMARQR